MTSSQQNLSPNVVQAVARELRKLTVDPLEGISVIVNEQNFTDIQAIIDGPVGTPYEGGAFLCKLVLPNDFPQTPPRGFFLTKIFHPNVAANGDICVNTLKKDWSANLGMSHIFQVIRCLMIIPFPESALNGDASKMFLENYDDYFKRAKLMTSVHATRKLGSGSSSSATNGKTIYSAGSDTIEKNNDLVCEEEKENTSIASKVVDSHAVKNYDKTIDKRKSERKRNLKRL